MDRADQQLRLPLEDRLEVLRSWILKADQFIRDFDRCCTGAEQWDNKNWRDRQAAMHLKDEWVRETLRERSFIEGWPSESG